MTLTHTEFEPLVWRPNKTVLNPNINPEVEYFAVDTEQYIGFQNIVGKPKHNKLPFAFITIKWTFTIESKATHKDLFYYEADDKHTADITNPDNKEQEIKKSIKTSYNRFAIHFESRKNELGLLEEDFPELSDDILFLVYEDLISRL